MGLSLSELPVEVLLYVFAEAEPSDLGRLAQVSKAFNRLIRGNQLLYKQQYLQYWDDPTSAPLSSEINWESRFQSITAGLKILSSSNEDTRRKQLALLASAVTSLTTTATTRNIPFLTKAFAPVTASTALASPSPSPLTQSALYARALGHTIHRSEAAAAHRTQLASAKLHVLYGVPQLRLRTSGSSSADGEDDGSSTAAVTAGAGEEGMDMYPYAASKVYDLRNYRAENHWGPFADDGSDNVDWEKLEAIMMVLGHNTRRIDGHGESSLTRLWRVPFAGAGPWSYIPVSESEEEEHDGGGHGGGALVHLFRAPWCRTKPDPELEKLDPYGVSGTWLRIVCFLDYRDLYEYNFGRGAQSRLRSEPRHPLNTDEAVRLICMTLVVTSVQYPDDTDAVPSTSLHADVPPSPPASTSAASGKMPIVTFTGTARALHSAWDPNANSAIRGTVSTTPEGEIRWTSVSVYHGDEERWKSEGIQVGGARSARGVMGSWFDKDYDPAGPAGPTAFWKIRDTVNCENRNTGGWGDGESDDEL